MAGAFTPKSPSAKEALLNGLNGYRLRDTSDRICREKKEDDSKEKLRNKNNAVKTVGPPVHHSGINQLH